MTKKHCTKSSRRRSKHQLFHTIHPYGSTKIQKNNWILPFWLYEHLQMTINHWTKFQVSPIGHLGKKVSTSYFKPSTPLGSTITHNWILPSWQYTYLQMKITLYKVSSIHSGIYKDKWTQDILTPATPLGSIITHRKIIGSSCPDNMHISKW
jgi:hypothetical protein